MVFNYLQSRRHENLLFYIMRRVYMYCINNFLFFLLFFAIQTYLISSCEINLVLSTKSTIIVQVIFSLQGIILGIGIKTTMMMKLVVATVATEILVLGSLRSVAAQCNGVYDVAQLNDAIQNANLYNNINSTLITLCSDFKLGAEVNNMPRGFDITNRNIRLRCNKTITGGMTSIPFATRNPRCIFDAENKLESIFHGDQAKISVFGTNFINSGILTSRLNFTYDMPPMIESGMSAWDFINSTLILQQCSFVNNTNRYGGGAITLLGLNSKITIRGGYRASQNLFYNNSGSYAGAIVFYGRQFQIGGKYNNFTNNQGDYVGAVAILGEFGYGSNKVNISGTAFVDNLSTRIVRTKLIRSIYKLDAIVTIFSIFDIKIYYYTHRHAC
jgi:hypothetical protein